MRCSFLAFILPLSLLAATPSADEILSQARKALGNVAGVKSLAIKGARKTSMETPEGPQTMTRDVELDFLLPDRFLKAETMELPNGIPGPTLLEALDGETAWQDMRNAPTGANVVIRTGPPGAGAAGAEQARARATRASFLRYVLLLTLIPPSGTEIKFDVVGEAEAPDGKAWMIDAAGPDGFSLRLFFDQKTSLPLMASWRGISARPVIRMSRMQHGEHGAGNEELPEMPKPKEVELELRLSDYEKSGGVLFPKLMTLQSGGKLAEEFEIKSVKVNPNQKPEKFRK